MLINGVSETVKHEIKNQRGRFISMFLRTLGAPMLGNMLTGKGAIKTGKGVI